MRPIRPVISQGKNALFFMTFDCFRGEVLLLCWYRSDRSVFKCQSKTQYQTYNSYQSQQQQIAWRTKSEFLAITCNLLKARVKSRVQDAIGFGFASYWLKNYGEVIKSVTKYSNRTCVYPRTRASSLSRSLHSVPHRIAAPLHFLSAPLAGLVEHQGCYAGDREFRLRVLK